MYEKLNHKKCNWINDEGCLNCFYRIIKLFCPNSTFQGQHAFFDSKKQWVAEKTLDSKTF